MIRVGIIGLGFMGRMHYRCWKELAGVKVTALCDANIEALKPSSEVKGNISGASDAIDFSDVKTFTDYDKLLASGLTDVVSITLPTHLHADFTVKALQAGQHVLCEKPMALTVDECTRMIDAAKKSGKLLQIGHCIRFWPEYEKLREILKEKKYGRLISARFQRFTPMPGWNAGNWLADEKRSGGMPMDLHIHDSDYIQHLFGMPKAVVSSADGAMSYISTTYLYENDSVITAEGSWAVTAEHGFNMNFKVIFEGATVVYDCAKTPSLMVYPAEGKGFAPPLEQGDGYSREVAHFHKRLNGGGADNILTPEQSRDTIRLVLAEKQSARMCEKTFV